MTRKIMVGKCAECGHEDWTLRKQYTCRKCGCGRIVIINKEEPNEKDAAITAPKK